MSNGWKFEVGKQAVCRRDGNWLDYDRGELRQGTVHPERDGVYTVKSIEPDDERPTLIWLTFDEFGPEQLYDSAQFEPVHTTDISALESLLAPAPKRRILEDA